MNKFSYEDYIRAKSKCSCGSKNFISKETRIINNYRMSTLICCESCGTLYRLDILADSFNKCGIDQSVIDCKALVHIPKEKIDEIIIRKTECGHNVIVNNKETGNLSFDETLGIIASLIIPDHKPCLRWLKTKEEMEFEKEMWKTNLF